MFHLLDSTQHTTAVSVIFKLVIESCIFVFMINRNSCEWNYVCSDIRFILKLTKDVRTLRFQHFLC